MSKQLSKVMDKLKKKKEEEIEDDDEEEEEEEEEESDDSDEEEEDEEEKPSPKTKESSKEEIINQEVTMLQNDGIFRRELLAVLHKIALILSGEDESKKE